MTAAVAPAADPLPGSQFPLGAAVRDGGTNFAVASGAADGMMLCLFDEAGTETRVPLLDYDAGVWHAFVPGVGPGQAYGYRATGPYDPARGIRCNPAKLLLDPYTRALHGTVTFGPEVLGYAAGGDPDAPSTLDSAAHVPHSLVVDEAFSWSDSDRPRRSYADTIIYEVHVKGFTMRHPGVPPELRGTYAGLGHEAAIRHLLDLGVTAVELLPVHESVPEAFLLQRGLTNYWGYNTIGYFAPHQGYSASVRAGRPGGQVTEFKAMVDTLHRAGLEVLLDVVFNHSAEGNQLGPTLCYRGLDNPAYHRLEPGDPRDYVDTTGCGNSLNVITANAKLGTGTRLLGTGAAIWLVDVITFGLWYWDLDQGGAAERATGTTRLPAFLFPEMTNPEVVRPGWYPSLIDYLHMSFATATAFSPTDVSAIKRWSKMLMTFESAVSAALAVLVVARAINILPS